MQLKHFNPIWFIRQSFSYMEGTAKWKIILFMPIAYVRYCYYMIKG
jgi:hypothetical protein